MEQQLDQDITYTSTEPQQLNLHDLPSADLLPGADMCSTNETSRGVSIRRFTATAAVVGTLVSACAVSRGSAEQYTNAKPSTVLETAPATANTSSVLPPGATTIAIPASPTSSESSTHSSTANTQTTGRTTMPSQTKNQPTAQSLKPAQAKPKAAQSTQPAQPKNTAVPVPLNEGDFTLTINAKAFGSISMSVQPMTVQPGQLIQPPEPANTKNWMDTTRWIDASAYPAAPSLGHTVVGGHYCVQHDCPLTPVKQNNDGSFTVAKGDTEQIRTSTGVLNYEVCNVGISDKYEKNPDGTYIKDANGNDVPAVLTLPPCAQDPDLLTIDCAEALDGPSVQNIIVAAILKSSSPSLVANQ